MPTVGGVTTARNPESGPTGAEGDYLTADEIDDIFGGGGAVVRPVRKLRDWQPDPELQALRQSAPARRSRRRQQSN